MSNEQIGADGGEGVVGDVGHVGRDSSRPAGDVGLKPDLQPDLQADLQDERLKLAAKAEEGMRALLERGAMDCLINVGVIKAATVTAQVSDTLIARAYIVIKQSRGYVGLPYRDENGRPATVADLETFCRVFLGRSYSRCKQLAANYHLLGEDLYEAAEEVGWRQRDYVALKALPEDQQEQVRELLASDDKDRALEVLADLVAKNAAKAQAAEAQVTATQELAQSLQERLADLREDNKIKDGIIGELKTETRRLKEGQTPDVTIRQDLMAHANAMRLVLAQALANLDQLQELMRRVELMEPPLEGTPEANAYRLGMIQIWEGLREPLHSRQYLFGEILDRLGRELEWRTLTPEALEERRRRNEAAAEGRSFHVVK